MNQPPPLLDIDTPEYVTLRRACEITGRSERTILRWCRAGAVEIVQRGEEYALNAWDLDIAMREAKRRQCASRFA